MKPLRPKSPFLVWLLAAALVSGCQKKPVAPPPQAQAPAPSETPAPSSETTQQTQGTKPPTQGTPPPDPGQVQAAEEKQESQPETQAADDKTDKNQAKPGRSRTAKKSTPPSTTARNTPPRIVVKPDSAQPSATPGQISPGSPGGDVSHDQANTEQLLQSSESNLNSIKRQLSPDEQAIVAQVRDYMTQSRQATKENDLVRARNLALKAHLLSDDLAKRR
jgi:hypothetical protein